MKDEVRSGFPFCAPSERIAQRLCLGHNLTAFAFVFPGLDTRLCCCRAVTKPVVNGYQQGRKSGGKGIERGFVFARQGLLEGARRASANDPWRAALVIGVW